MCLSIKRIKCLGISFSHCNLAEHQISEMSSEARAVHVLKILSVKYKNITFTVPLAENESQVYLLCGVIHRASGS